MTKYGFKVALLGITLKAIIVTVNQNFWRIYVRYWKGYISIAQSITN